MTVIGRHDLVTIEQACFRLASHQSERWLNEFLVKTKFDPYDRALYCVAGRSKLVFFDRLQAALIASAVENSARNARAKQDGGWVYFIAVGEFIKIGYSRSFGQRLHSLNTHASVAPEILHCEPGTPKQEKVFHRNFAAIRTRGEWFQKTPELLAFITQRKRIAGET